MISFILLMLLQSPLNNLHVIKHNSPIIANQTTSHSKQKCNFLLEIEEEPAEVTPYKKRKKRRL